MGDRGFESVSLHRRVYCEPDLRRPRQRNLRPRNAPRRRDRRHPIDNFAIRLGGVRKEAPDPIVGLGPDSTKRSPLPGGDIRGSRMTANGPSTSSVAV
jgi:hypothetical protein